MENTSGQGKAAVIPDEVKGLAWGAFLWSWIWGLFNRTWIALLAFVPIVGLVMCVMLLFKGREWAWRNKHWDSIEHFNMVQRRWAKAGLIVIFIVPLLGIVAAIVVHMLGNDAGQNVAEMPTLPPATITAKKTAPSVIVSNSAQNTAPAAYKPESADADFDSLLGPALTGFEKPGMTRSGPAILELSTFFGDSFWIKLSLPLIENFDMVPAPEISINSVLDASGNNFYDKTSNFETEFFRKANLARVSNPTPHLSGQRTVHIKPGLKEQALHKIEGQVRIVIPKDVKAVAFDTSEVGKEKTIHDGTVELKSLSGTKVVLHYKKTSNKTLGAVRGYDKNSVLVAIANRQGSILSGDIQIDFKGPVSRIEVLAAGSVVERQFPFALVRGSTTGSSPHMAEIASPSSALAASGSATAADEPEAIYAKFHKAGLTANFDEMLRYGTSHSELKSMSATERQAMLGFFAQILPKTYTVIRKTIEPDGKHTTLYLDASGAVGTISLIKVSGAWKVDKADWGGSSGVGEMSQNKKGAVAVMPATKRKLPIDTGESQPHTATNDREVEAAVVLERTHQVPPVNVITPKFNDVKTAVLRQDRAGVTELLDLGWWVDKPDSNGFTPLMEAVAMGDVPMAELLLKRGANPSAAARNGSTLQIAKHNRDIAMVELLRSYGAAGE